MSRKNGILNLVKKILNRRYEFIKRFSCFMTFIK